MEELGISQEALAAAIGCTQSAISKILTGNSQKSRLLPLIANELSLNLYWLIGITDNKIDENEYNLNPTNRNFFDNNIKESQKIELSDQIDCKNFENDFADILLNSKSSADDNATAPNHSSGELGIVPIRELDLAHGVGDGITSPRITSHVRFFPTEWIRQYTDAHSDELVFAHGIGDAMAPTLLDDDTLLIDCSDRELGLGDQIWVFTYYNHGMVKRLRPAEHGLLHLLSDNPAVPDVIDSENSVQLLGRVVAYMRKM